MASSFQKQSSIASSACAGERANVPILPLEIMKIIAENCDDKVLIKLSNASQALRKISCHVMNDRSFKNSELVFHHITDLPLELNPLSPTSLMQCYREFIMDDVTRFYLDQNTLDSVKTNLKAFVTNVISKRLLDTKESLRKAIQKEQCSCEQIQEKYKNLECSYVLRGIELLISSCHRDADQWELRSCAVIKAIEQNEHALAWMILNNGPSHDCLGDIMVRAAASKGYADIIIWLFDDMDPSNWVPETMEEALDVAIQSHQNEAVKILILNWNYSDETLKKALKTAINSENKSMISLILSCCEFSDKTLESVTMELLDENHDKYVLFLLEDTETNSFKLTDFALNAAISKNRLQLCRHILKKHHIHENDLEKAFDNAVTNKCKDIVHVFLKTGKMTKSVIERALAQLKNPEDEHMVQILSDHMLILNPIQ